MYKQELKSIFHYDKPKESTSGSLKSLRVTILSSPSCAQLGQTAVLTRLNCGGNGTLVEQMRQRRWSLDIGAFILG